MTFRRGFELEKPPQIIQGIACSDDNSVIPITIISVIKVAAKRVFSSFCFPLANNIMSTFSSYYIIMGSFFPVVIRVYCDSLLITTILLFSMHNSEWQHYFLVPIN